MATMKNLLVVLMLWSSSHAERNMTMELEPVDYDFMRDVPMHLPSTLEPLEYLIKINPGNGSSESFTGYVEILLKVIQPTSKIVLHVVDLDADWPASQIIQIDSTTDENRMLNIVNISWSEISQLMTLELNQTLEVDQKVRFSTNYSGNFVSNSLGFNRMEYLNNNQQRKRILATYFQPTGARHVFPCLDEPSLKANFTIHVVKQKGETVLSNMDVERITFEDSLHWVQFRKSPLMSTYVVAFVVFDFNRILRHLPGVTIRVWARDDVLKKASYSANIASRVLRWYESYFRVSYQLHKLDIVAFPTYTVAGMENFGLIFSKESALITRQDEVTQRAWVATVTAHEVSHQWAGNLVTPEWWNDVWLSEGLATFFTALALDEIEPQLESMNELVVRRIQHLRGQQTNRWSKSLVLHDFQPLRDPLKTVIIYYKGAAVLRMMKAFLGDETFREGIRHYFNINKFKSVSQNDFFNAMIESNPELSLALPAPLHEIMDSWTNRNGVPLVTVRRDDKGRFTVQQDVYYSREVSESEVIENKTRWWIPVSYYSSEQPYFHDVKPKMWVPPTPQEVALNETNGYETWLILNTQQMVDMRVNYDTFTWNNIIKVLYANHSAIHILNRAQLIDDAFKLFIDGHIGANISMELIGYLINERSYYSFKTLSDNILFLDPYLRPNKNFKLFKNYLASILVPVAADISGTDHVTRKLQNLLLSWSCALNQPECIKFAVSQFQEWKLNFNNSLFPIEDITPFLCAAIEAGNEADWDVVYKRMLESTETLEKRSYYFNSLTCTRSKKIIIKYLDQILEPDNDLQYYGEVTIMHTSLLRSERWAKVTWDHIRTNWSKYQTRFPFFGIPIVTTQSDLQQVELIISDRLYENTTMNKEIAEIILEQARTELAYATRITTSVTNWLKENVPI